MRSRPLTALAAAAILGSTALAAPASATGTTPPASIVAALAASAANNAPGSATDNNWNDLDILLAAVQALPLNALANPTGGPTLATALLGFTGTVFAPADASFRGLVADLTNTPAWKLTEADVLNTLLAVAGSTYQITGVGQVSGRLLLSETVKYHLTVAQIRDLRQPVNPRVLTLTQLPAVGLGDGEFDIKAPIFGLVGLRDDDGTDPDPFWFGRTVRTADGGTIHVIAGVLRPVDLAAVQGLLD